MATQTAEAEIDVSDIPDTIQVPPKEVRSFIERTASYVARNGSSFEGRILSNHGADPKFDFLRTEGSHRGYYEWRLHKLGGSAPGGRAAKPAGPAAPPEFQFSARMPSISAQDHEIIKLTALWVAKNGKQWMTALSQREAGNYQFDFLRPQHSFNQFFNRLVDQYSDLISSRNADNGNKEKEKQVKLYQNLRKKWDILDKAKARAEYTKYQEKQKKQREESDVKEKQEYASIDWADFVVAEKIIFDERDDEGDLPLPRNLNDLQTASLEQKALRAIGPTRRIEEAMPGELLYYNASVPQQPQQPPPPSPPSTWPTAQHGLPARPGAYPTTYPPMPPPPISPQPVGQMSPPPPAVPVTAAPASTPAATPSVPPGGRPAPAGRPGVPMNIRTDYVPRTAPIRRQQTTQICPNCKQAIPTEELQEHMRIELLDPRWKEQRARNEARNASTNLSTVDVANNLKRLASQRADVFDGVTGEVISEEEAARRKRAATNYDGFIPGAVSDRSTGRGGGAHKDAKFENPAGTRAPGQQPASPLPPQSVNVQEQLRHIREKNQKP